MSTGIMSSSTEDHLDAGMRILESQGYPRGDYVHASLAKNADGDPQVLVLGRNHIELRSLDGEVVLDAGIREIRGVRFVTGRGLEIWVTRRPGGADLRKCCWGHVLSDRDARYLEDAWLRTEPFVHTGIQLNRRPWREEEYAYYTGRVLAEAAQCEVRLSFLLSTVESLGWGLARSPKGKSGKPLGELLSAVGAVSPAFKDLAERYSAWHEWRNFSAHGIRYEESPGRPSRGVSKLKLKDDGTGNDFEVRDQDFRDLALLWRAFYSLGNDVRLIAMELHGVGGTIEERLRALSVPNSVQGKDRLPQETDGMFLN